MVRIDISNRALFVYGGLFILFLSVGFVIAYNSAGPPNVMGHSVEEIEGSIKYLSEPIMIYDESGVLGGAQVSGIISEISTINISAIVPPYAKGVMLSISSSYRTHDDVKSMQNYFAWSQLPPSSELILESPYLVLNSAAGKLRRTGGEGDYDYAGASNTFFIPLKDDKTFQIAKRQIQIGLDQGFSVNLIGYTS